MYQKRLLKNEKIKGRINIKDYIEKIIRNNVLIERGAIDKKQDVVIEKDLYSSQVNYLLNNAREENNKAISKYNVANYYFQLAKQFNRIAIERSISRNNLWNITKKNMIIKDQNITTQRLYKYIFRGEIIPSPEFVENSLNNNDDLISYLSIIYLDEIIKPELEESYRKLKEL